MALDRIQVVRVPDGEAGTRVTLQEMGRLIKAGKVNPVVYRVSRELVAHLAPKDWVGQVRALYEFVRDDIRYVHDPDGMQAIQTPTVTLELRAGNCAQKCILLASLLTSIGHPCQLCAVKMGNSPDFSHVFVRTVMGTGWLNLETTEGPIPMGSLGPNASLIVQPMMTYTVR